MHNNRNRGGHSGMRAALFGSACAMALMAVPAAAQDQTQGGTAGNAVPQGQTETVVVTGILSSLQKDLDIKRDSLGLVDAISAEDIGKFPDSNLAASMQRIPGVSISRGASSMGGVPTSTGDATEITVRGFGPSFNQTLYDGRQISTGTNNRAFDFSSVNADFVSQINIMKSPDATLSSGAIGATINIIFPKPFDHPGLRLTGSVSGTYNPDDGHPTPNADLFFSDTFLNDTFGVLADIAYSDSKTLANHVNNQGWEGIELAPSQLAGAAPGASTTADPNLKGWYDQDYGIYQEHDHEMRLNGRAVVQWRPNQSLLLTINDDYSRDDTRQAQYGYSVWFNGTSLQDVQQAKDGTIINFIQPNTPTDFQSQINGEVLQNNDFGVNVKWNVNQNFLLDMDADTAQSSLNPGGQLSSIDADVGYGSCASGTCINTNNLGLAIGGAGGNNLPYPTAYGPDGNMGEFLEPSVIGSHVFPMSSNHNVDTVNQAKVTGIWTEDNLELRFGAQWVSDHDTLSSRDDFTNTDWQAYSGYGPASGSPTGVALPTSFFGNSFSTAGFIPGFGNNGKLPARILQFNPYQVLNYLEGLGNPQTKAIPGFNGPPNVPTQCCSPPFDGTYTLVPVPSSFERINEDTLAGFFSAAITTKVASMPLKINVGVREEMTGVETYGIAQLPTKLTRQTGDITALIPTFSAPQTVEQSNRYSYLLPNLDMNLSVTDNLDVRFDASRTLTRPPLSDISPVLTFPSTERIGALQATGGNPDLLPYLSDNLDLGAQWYYAPNSYVSLDGFLKDVTNFVVEGATQQTANGVIDPTTGQLAQFTVTTNVNGPKAKVYGAEFALQHVFDDSGFGFQANATVVGTDKPYDPYDTSISGFAVTGLADSANLVAFYDKNGFQARIAANWRDGYLDHFGQQQNNSLFGTEPTFVNPNTEIDFSSSYDLTEQINLYFEALNLNNATYSTHGRFSEQVLDVVEFGRRFTVGVHWRL